MHVLIVTFELSGLSEVAYQQSAASIAPMFTRIVGLESKIWLADSQTNTYGGVYIFEDRESLERYCNSDVVRSMQANPNYANVSLRVFGTVQEATAITAGSLAPVSVGC